MYQGADDFSVASPKRTACIFCGRKADSREHFWGKWLQKVVNDPVRRDGDLSRIAHFVDVEKSGEVEVHQGPFSRPNPPLNATLRVVCTQCNNGWMKEIQDSMLSLKSKLFGSYEAVIYPGEHVRIINWPFLKKILVEATCGHALEASNPVKPYETRITEKMKSEWRDFYTNRTIPSDMIAVIGSLFPSDHGNTSHNYVPIVRVLEHGGIERFFVITFSVGELFFSLVRPISCIFQSRELIHLVRNGHLQMLDGENDVYIRQSLLTTNILENAIIHIADQILGRTLRRNNFGGPRKIGRRNHQTGCIEVEAFNGQAFVGAFPDYLPQLAP